MPSERSPQGEAVRPERLQRVLRLREAVGLGVGGTIGGGIFVLVGAAAGMAGPGALLSFVLAFGAALLISLPYAELACRYPQAGGGYAFVRNVLGREWGFLMGWAFWGAYVFVSGYVTLGFGGYLHSLTGIPPVPAAVGLIALSAILNIAGVRLSGRAQMAVVVVAAGGLLMFAGAGLGALDATRLIPLFPQGFGAVVSGALLAFLAFGGFDMIAAAGEEVERPERNLPLAILLTLAIVLGLYVLVTLVAVGVLPWQELGKSPAPLAEAAAASLGPTGRTLVALTAVLTTAATANAVLVVTSRISFAMARDGLLPRGLARVHPRRRTPWIAVLVNATLLGLVAVGGSIGLAVAVGGFLYVGHFLPPLIALAILRRGEPGPSSFRTPAPVIILPLAFTACVVLIVSSGSKGLVGGVGWLLLGLLLRAASVRMGRERRAELRVPGAVRGRASTPRPDRREEA